MSPTTKDTSKSSCIRANSAARSFRTAEIGQIGKKKHVHEHTQFEFAVSEYELAEEVVDGLNVEFRLKPCGLTGSLVGHSAYKIWSNINKKTY